VLESAVVIKT